MRRAAAVDSNQAHVVEELRKVGVTVEIIGKPLDLLIYHRGVTALIEVKNPDRTSADPDSRLTKAQVEFISRWPGKIYIVRSAEEAVRAVLGPEAMA